MSRCQPLKRPILRSLQKQQQQGVCPPAAFFTTTHSRSEDLVADSSTTASSSEPPPPPPPPPPSGKPTDPDWHTRKLDPNTTTLRWAEKRLAKLGTPPIGSRRRRVAIRTSANIPFEQLPYQAFQEARKVLQADRREKLAGIAETAAKLRQLELMRGAETTKMTPRKLEIKTRSLSAHLDELVILADINDPGVKRRHEDGMGDMSKPIYRHLADRDWRAMDYKIIQQRIEQFFIVPDLLPVLDPVADVKLFFRGEKVSPGEILDSRITEVPPSLKVRVFDRGERLLSVVVVDADVPSVEDQSFATRCHFMAVNVPWDPTKKSLPLSKIEAAGGQVAVKWLPPHSQKGSPYHRLAIFVMEHEEKLDAARLGAWAERKAEFSIQGFRNKAKVRPIGFNIFRTVWDEGTAEIMAKHNLPGADIEFKPEKHESMKPHRKARGWEAKRQGPKYKHLWKYTKRIA